MTRSRKSRKDRFRQQELASHTINTIPGSVEAIQGAPPPVITVVAYSPLELVEKEIQDPKEIETLLEKYPVTWVNVDGLGDVDKIKEIGHDSLCATSFGGWNLRYEL